MLYSGIDNTINASEGDDFITADSERSLFIYNAGDGNDTISGFNATSTLSISGDNYSTAVSVSDIIVTVSENKITLVGAASLASVNIDGEENFSNPVWTLKKTTATYGTLLETLITVKGVKSLSGISLSEKKVTKECAVYNILGIRVDGRKEILGLWIQDSESKHARRVEKSRRTRSRLHLYGWSFGALGGSTGDYKDFTAHFPKSDKTRRVF